MSEAVLSAVSVSKSFVASGGTTVLDDVSLELASEESVAITGVSGCGKSTLLHILGGLAVPDSGAVSLMGVSLTQAGQDARGKMRNAQLGFVYQFHHLLAEFTAAENVAMPLMIAGVKKRDALRIAHDQLAAVGLDAQSDKIPGMLSGGERQRVAIVRALVNNPACVIADEPTGNLDRHSAKVVTELLLKISDQAHHALLVATHDLELAHCFARVLELRDGKLCAAT